MRCVQTPIIKESVYPLQIPVNHPEVVHILQAIRNIHQLADESVKHLLGSNTDTYKRSPVCVRIHPNELVDVSMVHPLGNHRKDVLVERHSEQRQNVWMSKMLPGHHLSAKSL